MRFMLKMIVALAMIMGVVSVAEASATPPSPEHKVTLCHRTNSNTNPYLQISVDVASVKFKGHNGHDGPVWNPTLKDQHIKWGDIIPSFSVEEGYPFDYAGKNLSPEGQAILDNNCKPPVTPPKDVCPDVPGNQASKDECPEPPKDVCPDVPGNQTNEDECVVLIPPVS
jgi:hypothetical protein